MFCHFHWTFPFPHFVQSHIQSGNHSLLINILSSIGSEDITLSQSSSYFSGYFRSVSFPDSSSSACFPKVSLSLGSVQERLFSLLQVALLLSTSESPCKCPNSHIYASKFINQAFILRALLAIHMKPNMSKAELSIPKQITLPGILIHLDTQAWN